MFQISPDWTAHRPFLRRGAYVVRFRHRSTGVQRYISTGRKTPEDAMLFAIAWAQEHLLRPGRNEAPFRDVVRAFLKTKRVRPSTASDLELNFAMYERELAAPTVRSVSPADLDRFFANLRSRGRSERTLQKHLGALRDFFAWAKLRRYCENDPTEGFRFRSQPTKVRRPLSLAEQRRLLDAAREEKRPIRLAIYIALRTGLRQANVLELRWSWLDLDQGTITVPADEYKGRRVYKAALADDVVRLLRIRRRLFPGRSEYVLGDPGWSPRKPFLRSLKRAGIERDGSVDFHALRKTWASELEPRVSWATYKHLMGHAPSDVSLRYSAPSLDVQRAAVNSVPRPFDDSARVGDTSPEGRP